MAICRKPRKTRACRAFQNDLLRNPEQGDLLVGCRGLRKTRMALPARGKGGGARVIYLYLPDDHVLYLFLLFKKSDTANLSKAVFADLLNVPKATAVSWERGLRSPSGAAVRLLQIAQKRPKALLETAAHP